MFEHMEQLVFKWIVPMGHEDVLSTQAALGRKKAPHPGDKAEGGLGCMAIGFIFVLQLMALFSFAYHLVIRNSKPAERK